MFKLLGTVKPDTYERYAQRIGFATKQADHFYGIRYYEVKSAMLKSLYGFLPKEVHGDFYAGLMRINDSLPPHTDVLDAACLNCYLQPSGFVTHFYVAPNKLIGEVFSEGGNGLVYREEDLVLVGSFTAQPHEVYLLNNRAIHAVAKPDAKPSMRTVLQLATHKHSYAQLENMLIPTGDQ